MKESGEQTSPDGSTIASEPQRKTALDYFAFAWATVGVGYFPIAPGTMGSLVGVGLYLSIWSVCYAWLEGRAAHRRLDLLYIFTPQVAFMLIAIFVVTMIGIWAATRVEKIARKKDPSIVVIDEVSGQMIALLSGPFWIHTWWSILTAFILFRAFDIWKPYPIRRLEGLHGGLGIMLDDVGAGVYALIVNSILITGYLLLFP